MEYADLHIHSSFSDGSLTPNEIIQLAIKKDIRYISITDHDSIEAYNNITDNLSNINIIPGVEISSRYYEQEVHILGYYINIKNELLNKVVNKLYSDRIERVKEIVNKLRYYDVNISVEEVVTSNKVSVGRGNIAEVMVNKGIVENHSEAFSKFLSRGKCAYVPGRKLQCKEAIRIIQEAGGIPVLAHPGKICRDIIIEKMIREFKSFGIRGIEVYHPSHSRDKTNYFYNLSKKYKMLITGGSDFHGENKFKVDLGGVGISKELTNKIINSKGE